MSYVDFIRGKEVRNEPSGKLPPVSHDWLFPFQNFVVNRALNDGCCGVFGDTGLGKTRMQLAIANQVAQITGKPSLILCPISVAGQTIREGARVGVSVKHLNDAGDAPVEIINYEQLKMVRANRYNAVLLDESSILKDSHSKTKNALCETFSRTPHRFCFTATPAPNDHTEIGCHSEFLGIMSMTAMLSRWFVHDSYNTADWRLKKHAQDDFWQWVASWAIAFRKPSNLGFEDTGYILPELHVEQHLVDVGVDVESGQLIHDARLSATTLHKEMRRTSPKRAEAVADIANTDDIWCIWCDTDYEAAEIKKRIPGIVEIHGALPERMKEKLVLDFADGKIQKLLTKPSITGHGVNWQVCNHTVVCGASYSFERVYQLVRRFWRFGQDKEVYAHMVSADTEWSVVEKADLKRERHEQMLNEMVKNINKGQKANRLTTEGGNISIPEWL